MCSIAGKFGCTAETLRRRVRQAERDRGAGPGMTSDDRERVGALELELRELRQANEILRKASAWFAQAEFGRPLKRRSLSSTSIAIPMPPARGTLHPVAAIFVNPLAQLIRAGEQRSRRSRARGNLDLLLRAGADPNARDRDGGTPLHAAARHGGYPAMVEQLLDAGADSAASDNAGRRPADYARGRKELARTRAWRRLLGGGS